MRRVVILCLALSGCYDPGGQFADRLPYIQAQAQVTTPLVLPRQCDSACTLYLQDAQVCIRRNGSIGVHAGSVNGVPDQAATQYMFNAYWRFPAFQEAIIRDKAMATLRIRVYTARQMNSFGVPYCA